MSGVALDVGSEISPHSARFRLFRVGRPHKVSPFNYGILFFKSHHNYRAARHKLHEAFEERPLAMHGVESFGLALGQAKHLQCANLEAVVGDSLYDVAGMICRNSVRLDNAQCRFAHYDEILLCSSAVGNQQSASIVYIPNADFTVAPMSAGLLTTRIPHSVIVFIFSAAVPFPPAMMAPACPIRRPGGAVWPAMNPITGFFMRSFTN